MTRGQIVYSILDLIKSVNNDSYIQEEHVLFLMNVYRGYLIELKKKQDKLFDINLSLEYYQTICLDLEPINLLPNSPCGEILLRSIQEVPTISDYSKTSIYPTSAINVYNQLSGLYEPVILPYDYINDNFTIVSRDRFKYVGYNKYMKNIIYSTLGYDHHVYMKSNNPQYKYLNKIKLSAIFEDEDKAAELSCNKDSDDGCKDVLDLDFPIAADLVPLMILMIVKELKQAMYTPADDVNDARDTVADLMTFIRRNMKNNFEKQLTE